MGGLALGYHMFRHHQVSLGAGEMRLPTSSTSCFLFGKITSS